MRFLTDFADLAVVLPLALCFGAALGSAGWWRGVGAWSMGVVATLGAMLGLKLLFLACAAGPDAAAFSPSGHTAAGGVLYGGMGALWLRQRFALWPSVGIGGLPAAALIGGTRLALHVHSWPEVFLGAAVGLVGLACMLRLAGAPPEGLRVGRGILVAVPIILLLHGVRLPAEVGIRNFAGWLPAPVCAALRF